MGWLFPYGSNKKSLIADRVSSWTNENRRDGTIVRSVCLKHCYRGNSFSGILWSVRSHTMEFMGIPFKTETYITCDKMEWSTKLDCWGYKDMCEADGPLYYSCPLSYLKLAPKVEDATWRAYVRDHNDRVQTKRKATIARNKAQRELHRIY